MFCDACGADLGNRPIKFCPQCGALLQAAPPEPEKAAASETAGAPLPESPPPAGTAPGALTETRISPLSSITLDAIPAFDFAPPIMAPAFEEDKPPAAAVETAPGPDAGPSGPAQAPPDVPPEPEETAADARPEPAEPTTVLLEETASALPVRETVETAAGIEPAPPTVIPDFEPFLAESAPATPETSPSNIAPGGSAVPPGWEERYAPEISTMTSLAEWGRIEPTMSGTRAFPLPVEPPPRANGSMFAVIGAAAVLVLALSGIWWFSDGTASAPEAVPKDTPELSSGMSLPLAVGTTNETPPAETLATPAQETGEPLPAFDPASSLEPDAPLLVIPPLPANQQPGKHNRIDNVIEPLPDIPLASEASASVPLPAAASRTRSSPAPSSSTVSAGSSPPVRPPSLSRPPIIAPIPLPLPPLPRRDADIAVSKREPMRAVVPERNPPPALTSPSIDEPGRERHARPRQDSPSWRSHLRQELSNCEDFFCRERARRQYCSERWKTLPECRGASL
ncbi:MAG: hypothetical protein LBF61_10305 [Azoarcus sp.]|jgi:hypothetical protein|nr:hypothetical protein [Azoarcus sp.]